MTMSITSRLPRLSMRLLSLPGVRACSSVAGAQQTLRSADKTENKYFIQYDVTISLFSKID